MRVWIAGILLVGATTTLLARSGAFETEFVADARQWRVVDVKGNPVEGATISLLRESEWSVENAPPALRTTTTNREGRFELDLERGICTHAWKPGYVGVAHDLESRSTNELVLRPAATLSGKLVRSEDGAPVVDAGVVPLNSGCPKWQVATRTADDGSFRVDGLNPEYAYLFSIEPRSAIPFELEFETDEPRHYETIFEVPPSEHRFRGIVHEGATTRPVSGATISAWVGTREHEVDVATSREDGTFELDGAIVGEFFGVTASKSGFALARYEFANRVFDPTRLYEMRIVPERSIEGQILDLEGRPFTEGSILVYGLSTFGDHKPPDELSALESVADLEVGAYSVQSEPDAAGRFRIAGLLSSIDYAFLFIHPDGWVAARELGSRPEPARERQCELRLSRRLARVYGSISVNGELVDGRVEAKQGDVHFGPNRHREEGARGFDLAVPATGRAELRAQIDPYFDEVIRTEEIELMPGLAQRREIAIERDLSRIRGRVEITSLESSSSDSADAATSSATNSRSAGVRVIAQREADGARAETTTREDGSFELALPDARWSQWSVDLDPIRFPRFSIETYSGADAANFFLEIRD